MAPPPSITIIDPPAWQRSTATTLSLNLLVAGGQLAANVDGQPADQRSEEFRLREQQGLSSPGTEEYSSSSEEEEEEGEEEEDRGRFLPDRWEPAPPSPEPTVTTRPGKYRTIA
jgi:hypothetical protein